MNHLISSCPRLASIRWLGKRCSHLSAFFFWVNFSFRSRNSLDWPDPKRGKERLEFLLTWKAIFSTKSCDLFFQSYAIKFQRFIKYTCTCFIFDPRRRIYYPTRLFFVPLIKWHSPPLFFRCFYTFQFKCPAFIILAIFTRTRRSEFDVHLQIMKFAISDRATTVKTSSK